ncbi:MAG TPA: ABC transporter permease [Gemmatimonadaceae bacterium]|nr:ABC transporter permease [Gemmatimonadaceae bacterium]
MAKIGALVRAAWLAALSYRLGFILSVSTLLFTVVPFYFVANALQPTMAGVIQGEGHQYFGFLIVGMMVVTVVTATLYALPNAISAGVANGTLEALFTTPTPVWVLLAGLSGYEVLFAIVRATALLLAAAAFGAHVAWDRMGPALPILILLILAHIPIGLIGGAMILAFRTAGPLSQIVLTLSVFLGGTYYPTHVIPGWLEGVSGLLPMTYGLRALRGVLLEGLPFAGVARDVAVLAAFAVVLTVASVLAFRAALKYAKRTGSLAQY